MSITFTKGNLFDSSAQTLGHGCNTKGKMGAGIALDFKRRFPDMYKEYRRRCYKDMLNPGGYFLYKHSEPWVLNLATQASSLSAHIEYVEQCLGSLTNNYKSEGMKSLALPRIASGLGGLEWGEVKRLLIYHLDPLDIPVTVYEEYEA